MGLNCKDLLTSGFFFFPVHTCTIFCGWESMDMEDQLYAMIHNTLQRGLEHLRILVSVEGLGTILHDVVESKVICGLSTGGGGMPG